MGCVTGSVNNVRLGSLTGLSQSDGHKDGWTDTGARPVPRMENSSLTYRPSSPDCRRQPQSFLTFWSNGSLDIAYVVQ